MLSYLLMSGQRPLAAQIGIRYRGTYIVQKTYHDAAFDPFSPGTNLLLSVIDDLITTRSARLINLGFGSDHYRLDATYASSQYTTLSLIRKNWHRRLSFGTYSAVPSDSRPCAMVS